MSSSAMPFMPKGNAGGRYSLLQCWEGMSLHAEAVLTRQQCGKACCHMFFSMANGRVARRAILISQRPISSQWQPGASWRTTASRW